MNDDLSRRISRIYAAVNAAEEVDLSKLTGVVVETDKFVGVWNDFTGGLSDAELSNLAYSLIHNIANLPEHLRKWAARNSKDKGKVDEVFAQSFPLRVIADLSNNDKHGDITRAGEYGHSGKRPKLIEINRVLRMTATPGGSGVAMTLNRDGTPKVIGGGSAKAIITGDIIDKDDNKMGELNQIAHEAIADLEGILEELQNED